MCNRNFNWFVFFAYALVLITEYSDKNKMSKRYEKIERKRVMVKQMVFKTEHNANNQKVYICPFCGRSWRKLDNAIACYEQCEQKPLNTLKN